MNLRVGLMGLSLLAMTGCATLHPQAVGQTLGTIAGAAVAPGIGAPVGALIGLLTGTLLQGEFNRVVAKQERIELGEQLKTRPAGTVLANEPGPAGTTTRVWIDETVRDGRVVLGHYDVWQAP
jgi:hypothetical protein